MEGLRKLDRKFLIFIGCLILIPVLLILFLIMAQGCSNKKTNYTKYEFEMKSAAKKYLKKVDQVPSEDGDYIIVNLDTLVEQSYIESTAKKLNDKTCTGYVGARKEGSITYTAVLNCDGYKTNTLAETLKKDLTTESDGLYKTKDGYVFRGLNVNNYIKLGDTEYRIIGIDKNNAVKLMKTETENLQIRWDSKYNINTKTSAGINLYKDSYMLERLNRIYNESAKLKKYKAFMVPTTVCVRSQKTKDRFMSEDCKETLENQYISLIGIDDYKNASLDPNCVDIYSKSCRNYNYLGRMSVSTWTKDVVADNDYQVFYLSNGIPYAEEASRYESYNIVIFINGDISVKSGKGTKQLPYVLK